ncbi:phosphonate ABC transporter, permease protein PhnE [Spirochaetia bacterium]|nr:phosphonate ABC transporter, permease protein PhnE [Spirochaetia bacterium]
MPVFIRDEKRYWDRKSGIEKRNEFLIGLICLVITAIALRYIIGQTIWEFVADAPRQIGDFLSRMFPPDMRYLNRVWPSLWDTFNISVFGTAAAVILSVPLAILAAKNTSPHGIVRAISLCIIVTSRAVNSMIWAMILVQLVGPGMFAGVLAIAVRSIGMISKLFYEAIEEINPEPIEAIKATGASGPQVFLYGYIPQLLPTFVGVAVYRWENNIRESAVIGMIGGGGLGFVLNSAINRLAWNQVLVVLIIILGTVTVSEWVSNRVRTAIY